jgi:CheY-like chemotaxis protein
MLRQLDPACYLPDFSPIPGRNIGSSHVLLLENDRAARLATQKLLQGEGYRVTAVASLDEAMLHLREIKGVDVLITDYHLPDGTCSTRVIATLRETLDLPLEAILVTADPSRAMRTLSFDSRLRVTTKPICGVQLLALLRDLLAGED